MQKLKQKIFILLFLTILLICLAGMLITCAQPEASSKKKKKKKPAPDKIEVLISPSTMDTYVNETFVTDVILNTTKSIGQFSFTISYLQ